MAEERVQRRLAAILAADVVGYSRIVEADETGTVTRLKALQVDLLYPMINHDNGRVVKIVGDGILVEFGSAVDAVRNALAIQGEIERRNADLPIETRITFRVGVNVGDVIIDGDDIHGDGVNVAARLESLCEPGAVFISGTVHDHVDGKLPAVFDDLGDQTVKNIVRPVRVYRVREESEFGPNRTKGASEPSLRGSSENDPGWRKLTTVSSLMAYPFLRKTGVFINARIRHLQSPSPRFSYSSICVATTVSRRTTSISISKSVNGASTTALRSIS